MAVQTATKPEGPTGDFQGDIKVDNTPPNAKMLANAASLTLLDENNKKHTFKSLYGGKGRVIVVFIRHFFCGNCQEYTKTLAEELPPDMLSALPTPTSLVLIGCGAAELIPMYKTSTKTPFPIYADPTRKIYDVLGMTRSLSLGDKQPRYMKQPIYKLSLKSVLMGLQSGRNALSGGNFWQVGGEFVFEPNGTIDWCHRMKNTRDHAEMDELRKAIHINNEPEAVAAVPPGKPIGSRRSMSGAGLGRKLSDRRKSWRNSLGRGRSRKDDADGSLLAPTMEKLKEEPGAPDGDRDDALTKLTQGASDYNAHATTNGTVPNGHATNGHALEPAVNGAPTNGSAIEPASSTESQAVVDDSAVKPAAKETNLEPTANGGLLHNSTPFVQNLMNGSYGKTENDEPSTESTGMANGTTIKENAVETGEVAANGHAIEA